MCFHELMNKFRYLSPIPTRRYLCDRQQLILSPITLWVWPIYWATGQLTKLVLATGMRAIVGQSSGDRRTIVGQSSGNRRVIIGRSSGNRRVIVGRSSGNRRALGGSRREQPSGSDPFSACLNVYFCDYWISSAVILAFFM